jgi:hypothetical protein
VLIAVVCAAGVSPAVASAGWTGFATPSRNIVCNGSAASIDCVVFSASRTCQKTWVLKTSGRASVHCYFSNIATDVPVLPYGRSVTRSGMRCLSSRRGLTCTNSARHGFFLSRESQRTF